MARALFGFLLSALLAPVAFAAKMNLMNPRSLADCGRAQRTRPRELDSYRCFWVVGMRFGQMKAAARGLRSILRRRPGEPRAQLYLAVMAMQEGRRGGEDLMRAASDGLHRQHEHRGEVYARTSLASYLAVRGRHREAQEQLHLASVAAVASGKPPLIAMVHIWRGYQSHAQEDFGKALFWLKKAEGLLFPHGPGWLQRKLSRGLGETYRAMGRHREAFEAIRREARLFKRERIPFQEAWARFRLAYQAGFLVQADELTLREWDGLIRDALSASQRGGNRLAESDVRLWLLAARATSANSAVKELERVISLTKGAADNRENGTAFRMLAKALVHQSPPRVGRALALLARAIELASANGGLWPLAEALLDRAYVRWRVGPRERAITESFQALDLVDRLRGLQPEGLVRARVGSMWAFAYYLVAGSLLVHGERTRRDLDLSLRAMERLRARTLLESYEAARRGARSDETARWREKFDGVLARITAAQRRLLASKSTPSQRRRARQELRRREAEAELLRGERARKNQTLAALMAQGIPSLDDAQRALDTGSALLVFQVPPPVMERRLLEDVGSWVLVVTRETARAHRLPKRETLEETAALFRQVVAKRDRSEGTAAARLYRDLLAAALGGLPAGVHRLVIVPDGALHRVPFGALRAAPEAAPLAARYELSLVPSVALWLRFNRTRVSIPASVLAIADPRTVAGAADAGPNPTGTSLFRTRLGRLPFARREAASAVRFMGNGSRVLSGGQATERALKATDLRHFGILHFAAHAVVDEVRPERSAIMLAPGGADEDGLLQFREVADLDLRGKLVLLSACRSSFGALMAGEGVMSLARAFLQAGARAIVGSLWPLRDDETATLIAAFYRHLARGHSVGQALSAARRDRIAAGSRAAAWAGLVVIGDSELVPLPGGRPIGWPVWLWTLLGLALAIGLGALLRRRGRKSR